MISREKVYNLSIDFLRIISILAVVLIHTTTRTLATSANDLDHFSFSLFLNQISRFAVPTFFIISGFVLELNYSFHHSFLAYFKKRISRILIPYIFWSLIYTQFIYLRPLSHLPQILIKGDASYQLYFIPVLILFYLIFPLIRRIKFTKIILIILFLIQISLLAYDYYVKPLSFDIQINILLFNFFPFIFGMAVSRQKNLSLIFKKNLLIFPILILAIYVYFQAKTKFNLSQNYLSYYSQWRPGVLIYSMAIFMIFYLTKFSQSLIKTISGLSFFVYFIHIIILELVWHLIGHLYSQLWFDPIFFSLTTIISYLIAYLIHKLPGLIRLTG